jgi:hypothetical protein
MAAFVEPFIAELAMRLEVEVDWQAPLVNGAQKKPLDFGRG